MSETMTYTRRTVAHEARAFGREAGLEFKACGPTARGRVPADLVFQYLTAQKPATVREIADALGVEHTMKGKPSEALLVAITDAVVKNAPKVEAE